MDLLFELSKEHPTLPSGEICSCLKAENIPYTIIDTNDDILALSVNVDFDTLHYISSRLSHAYVINKLIFLCTNSLKEIEKYAKKYSIYIVGSIAIRTINRSKNKNSQEIINLLADIYITTNKVDLNNPDSEIRVFITDSTIYVSHKLFTIDRTQFERRKAQFRPYFSPISLHPKIARALVNLSCITKDDILYDPFCGTGGILIEAGLIGIRVIGSDISTKMVQGTKKNLSSFNIRPLQLFTADIGDIDTFLRGQVDAVVTEFPFGRAATTRGELRESLYTRAFQEIAAALKPNGRAVLGVPSEKTINTGKKYLTLQAFYKMPIHRSLTRFFTVFEKQP